MEKLQVKNMKGTMRYVNNVERGEYLKNQQKAKEQGIKSLNLTRLDEENPTPAIRIIYILVSLEKLLFKNNISVVVNISRQ